MRTYGVFVLRVYTINDTTYTYSFTCTAEDGDEDWLAMWWSVTVRHRAATGRVRMKVEVSLWVEADTRLIVLEGCEGYVHRGKHHGG